MISNKYNLLEQISKGAYGILYKGINHRTNELVAIKIEEKKNDSLLINESKVYQYLGKMTGIPQLKWFGTDDKYNYMVIELLDISLLSIIKQYILSLNTTIQLSIQMLKIIQSIHEKNLVHRDIKPENFLFGLNDKKNQLYLIDFGFTKTFIKDEKHIEMKKTTCIIGTSNFVSINVHKGCEPSRRDDLESFLYVMLYLLRGTLEWSKESNDNDKCKIKESLINNIEIPYFYRIMLLYVRGLKFEEKPNYEFLFKILELEIMEKNK